LAVFSLQGFKFIYLNDDFSDFILYYGKRGLVKERK
jgi:hypothetical protein